MSGWGVRPQHPHPQFASVFHELSKNKRHSHFRTRSYKSDSYMFIMTSYRRKPFVAVKKRPRKKPVLNSPAKRRLKTFNNIAKIKHNNNNSTKGQNVSASHTKITHNSSSSQSDISSDEENADSPQYWIFDILNIVAAFSKACVYRKCHGNVELLEIESSRAGLGTKFSI